jgi:hypothetical protein
MELAEYFTRGYDKLIVPAVVRNVPIPMAKMLREDGSYHSIATLEETLGSLVSPVMAIDERFIMIHYGFSRNGEEQAFKDMLTGMGMVDMRYQDGQYDKTVDEIDFVNLTGNEFGVFSDWEYGLIPVPEVEV